ncbi:MAG TPA: WD40 repeat domain-containing protein [Ktedonobacteraceae bacterium]|nr:WD40 repeat domain-containing protein [Ktedonobacteraceae bacterium]
MSVDLPEDQVANKSSSLTSGVAGSIKFDWIFLLLSGWLVTGVYVDGWAHNHFNIIDTFFTPWHALLYSGFLAVTSFLVVALLRNHRKGYAWENALPPGYGLSLLGIAIFGIGGVADYFWHKLFGFEVELATLLSPTHLLLAAGGLLIVSGPLRAGWARADIADAADAPGTWKSALRALYSRLPLILSLTFVLSDLSFITSYAHPFVTLPATAPFHSSGLGQFSIYLNDLVEAGGVVSILLQTALLFGTTLVAMRRVRLPVGTFTIMLTINLSAISVLVENFFLIPAAVLGGLVADALFWYFRPSIDRPDALRLFTFLVPVSLFSIYFLDLRLFKSVWWPIQIWMGSIVLAGFTGLLLSYVFVSPLKQAAQAVSASFRLSRRKVIVGLASLSLAIGGLIEVENLLMRQTSSQANRSPFTSGPLPFYLYAYTTLVTLNVSTLQYYASSAVNRIAWSPDGKMIASGNADGTIQLWRAVRAAVASSAPIDTPLLTYRKHTGAVTDLAWLPGTTFIASASEDGTVQLWNTLSGAAHLVYRGHSGRVFSVSAAPDGRQIASAGQDRTVQIWDAATGLPISTYRGHTASVVAVRWSPEGERIASSSSDGHVRVWLASSGELLLTLKVDVGKSSDLPVEWSPDARSLATVAGGNVSTWNASTGLLLDQYVISSGSQSSGALNMAWSPVGGNVVTAQADGSVWVWAAPTPRNGLPNTDQAAIRMPSGNVTTLSGEGGGAIQSTIILSYGGYNAAATSVACSPDGRYVVAASEDQTVQVLDTTVGMTLLTYANKNVLPSATWSSDGRRIASAGNSGSILVWDAATGDTLLSYEEHPAKSSVTQIRWSPNDQQIASISSDGTMLVWNAATGATLLRRLQSGQTYTGVTWSDDGKHLALVNQDGQIQLLDITTARTLHATPQHEGGASSAVWSLDGKRVAIINTNGYVQVWDALNGAALLAPLVKYGLVQAVSWSPDGRRIATSQLSVVQVWDAGTGDIICTCDGAAYPITSISWSSDNRHLAFAGNQGVVVWDISTQTMLLTYQGMNWDSTQVPVVTWSPDGRRIASSSALGSVQVWLALAE